MHNAATVIPGYLSEPDDLLVRSRDGQDLLLRDARTANTPCPTGPISNQQVATIDDQPTEAPPR